MTIKRWILVTAICVSAAASAVAEESAELGLRHATARQASVEQLKQFTWQTDTMLLQGGEAKVHVTVANRLNEKGEMVQTVETAETNVRKKRGLRGRSQAQKADEVGQLVNQIVVTMASYIFMSKGQEVDFFDKATITDGTGADAGKLVVQGANVSVPGDLVTKWIDPETLYTTKITFEAVINEVAVLGEVLFRPIENGPNVPRMATVDMPSMEGVMSTEFLEYKKQL